MNGKTHAAAGIFIGSAVIAMSSIPTEPANLFLLGAVPGYLGGILPDIDQPNSTASNKNLLFKITGHTMNHLFGHRGFIHSLLCGMLLSMICYFGFLLFSISNASWIAFTFFTGYASHLLLDMLNPKGVPVFWPLPVKIHIASFRSNGFMNLLLTIVFALLIMFLYAHAFCIF